MDERQNRRSRASAVREVLLFPFLWAGGPESRDQVMQGMHRQGECKSLLKLFLLSHIRFYLVYVVK